MAAGDLVQKGTSVTVGFNSITNSNLIMQAATETVGASEMSSVLSEQGAAVTNIFINPHKRIRLQGVLLDTAGLAAELAAIRGLILGDTVSVNSVNCMLIETPVIEFSAGEARVTLVVIKEDSMTYS